MNADHTRDTDNGQDPGAGPMHDALQALARAERGRATEGLESRVFGASVRALRASAVAHASSDDQGTIPFSTIRHAGREAQGVADTSGRARGAGHAGRRLAIAAGLGAMVCAAAAWLALRGGPAAPGPDPRIAQAPSAGGLDADADLDAMFLAARLLTGGIDEEIALIQAEAATLGLGLADPITAGWSDAFWAGESL